MFEGGLRVGAQRERSTLETTHKQPKPPGERQGKNEPGKLNCNAEQLHCLFRLRFELDICSSFAFPSLPVVELVGSDLSSFTTACIQLLTEVNQCDKAWGKNIIPIIYINI